MGEKEKAKLNENQVRFLFEDGMNCREIADWLKVDPKAVRNAVCRIYGKNTVEEARRAMCSYYHTEVAMLRKKLNDHKEKIFSEKSR